MKALENSKLDNQAAQELGEEAEHGRQELEGDGLRAF